MGKRKKPILKKPKHEETCPCMYCGFYYAQQDGLKRMTAEQRAKYAQH